MLYLGDRPFLNDLLMPALHTAVSGEQRHHLPRPALHTPGTDKHACLAELDGMQQTAMHMLIVADEMRMCRSGNRRAAVAVGMREGGRPKLELATLRFAGQMHGATLLYHWVVETTNGAYVQDPLDQP